MEALDPSTCATYTPLAEDTTDARSAKPVGPVSEIERLGLHEGFRITYPSCRLNPRYGTDPARMSQPEPVPFRVATGAPGKEFDDHHLALLRPPTHPKVKDQFASELGTHLLSLDGIRNKRRRI